MPSWTERRSDRGHEYEDESNGKEEQWIDVENERYKAEQTEEVQQIHSNEEAGKVLRNMNSHMQSVFFQHLLTCGDFDAERMRSRLASMAAQSRTSEATQAVKARTTTDRTGRARHTTPAAKAKAAAQAAANKVTVEGMKIAVPPNDAYRMRQEAWTDAQARVIVALEAIVAAEREMGHTHQSLHRARAILRDKTGSMQRLAERAAEAQQLVHQVLINCDEEDMQPSEKLTAREADAVRVAHRHIRDIVMLCCRAQAGIKDRTEFLNRAAQAYNVKRLSQDVHAAILLSYAQDPKNVACGFASNNAYNTYKHGPRSMKQRNSSDTNITSADQEQGDPSACAAAESMSLEPTIYTDQQTSKGEDRGEFDEIVRTIQKTSPLKYGEHWDIDRDTFPNYAIPGQPSLAYQTSDIHWLYQDPIIFMQQCSAYLEAQAWYMEQNAWYDTLQSYSHDQIADTPGNTTASRSTIENTSNNSDASAYSKSAADTQAQDHMLVFCVED